MAFFDQYTLLFHKENPGLSNEHWLFERWEGDYNGTENPVSLIMDADYAITARFVKVDYPLTIEIEGKETVSQQIDRAKATQYPHGTQAGNTIQRKTNPLNRKR